jgi:hypothetical protein
MADNARKTPLVHSLNAFADKKILNAIQNLGKALPCSVVSVSGAIITVKFEVVTDYTLPQVAIPLFGPEYIRYPIKKGDLGVCLPMDTHIANITGMGDTSTSLSSQPGNLSALVFLPVANTAWSTVDINAVTIYSPNGVVLRDDKSKSTFILTPANIVMVAQNQVQITSGGCVITMKSDGTFLISGNTVTVKDSSHLTSPSIMNAAWLAMVTWLNAHEHTSSSLGSPTSPPIIPFDGSSIAP